MTTADVAEALRLAGEGRPEPLLNAEFAEWLPGRKGAIYRVMFRDVGGIAEGFVLVTHFSRGPFESPALRSCGPVP